MDALHDAAFNSPVTEDHLAKVIELWSGIPASKVKESELQKVADLETGLKKRIIGQDEAVNAVAAAVRRSRIRLSAKKRPASFIFVGPTGVGKTELVKVLSEELFDNVEPLIRLDMSEFMEKHSVSRIIGSPPGYVGYDEAGQLTEKVRRRPYSIVLFDEIEKAHPDVMNILLQILDEGRITDAQGRQVSFENTIIIMTSNAGSERQGSALGFDKTRYDDAKDKAETSLRQFLRPEFLARVDEVVVFRPLTEEDMQKIAALMLEELRQGWEVTSQELADTVCGRYLMEDALRRADFWARRLTRAVEDMADYPAVYKAYGHRFLEVAQGLEALRDKAAGGWDSLAQGVPSFRRMGVAKEFGSFSA